MQSNVRISTSPSRVLSSIFWNFGQRCADKPLLCFLRGGLGLTGGIADIGSLADCLLGIYSGKAGMDILDKYDEVRTGIYRDIIDPLSTTNMNRMSQDANTIFETDEFLQTAALAGNDRKLAADMFMVSKFFALSYHPVAHLNVPFVGRVSSDIRTTLQRDLALGYDMTRFYDNDATDNGTIPDEGKQQPLFSNL